MIKSMTGYAKITKTISNKQITIEIKTLNSKTIDINIKVPPVLRSKELEIRNIISNIFERGKIEFIVSFNNIEHNDTELISLNKFQLLKYYDELQTIVPSIKNQNKADIITKLLSLPNSFIINENELSDNLWKNIEKQIKLCATKVNNYRIKEGKILEKEFKKHINYIIDLTEQIKQLEPIRTENIRKKLKDKIDSILANNQNIDNIRFEQEILFYLERNDITEEITRLINNCNYFIETLSSHSSEGKKLSFICQEMLREANTLGAKANNFDIQKKIVLIKDCIEKIREQLANIL